MEYIVQILAVFAWLGVLLKVSFWRTWQVCLFGLVCGAFVVMSCRWAVLQSKTALAEMLENPSVMRDAAVLVTIDAALIFAFCFARLRAATGSAERRWWSAPIYYYPGLLVLPLLFWLQTQLIFAMPGVRFTTTSWLMAAGAGAGIPLASLGLRRLCPSEEVRAEACLLVGLFVCIIGLVATVNGNVTYAAVSEAIDGRAIALAAGIFVTLFVAGLILNRLKTWK